MRHDWWMSADPAALKAATVSALNTWRNDDLGGPALYPNDYLFYLYALTLEMLFAPAVVLAVIAATIGLLAFLAARSLADDDRAYVAVAGALLVLLFNPWTYTELVAGHLPMLVSFAGLALLAAESLKGPRASPILQCAGTIAAAQQLQFLVLVLPATAALWIVCRRWQPFAVAAVLALPAVAGVFLGRADLAQIPYTLDWERSQSLHLPAVLGLRGYFARYDDALGRFATAGCALLLALALASLACARRRIQWAAAAAVCIVIFFVLGTNGPAAAIYAFAVTNVKATGIFRELYDLVAFIAIGYLIVIAAGLAQRAWLAGGLVLAGACMLLSWVHAPPARFWVASSGIPVSSIDVGPNQRFAVFPAFQPLQFAGQGSGTDPDVFDRPEGVAPVNAYLPVYPVVSALARYAKTADPRPLAGLSVSEAVQRPWLCTDVPTLRAQVGGSQASGPVCGSKTGPTHFAGIAELSVLDGYGIGTLNRNLGAGNLLAVDAARAGLIADDPAATVIPKPTTAGVDPSQGWIDARLVFPADPAYGQAYGGVFTTSNQPLRVLAGDRLLALVRGRLTDDSDRRLLAAGSSNSDYAWVESASGSVRCAGRCVIAAEAPPDGYPLDPPDRAWIPATFRVLVPWLIDADIPAMRAGAMLRYNVTYSPYWSIFGAGTALRHVRVDGAVNGWIAPAGSPASRAFIVEVRSCIEALLEALACVVLLVAGVASAVSKRRHHA